MLPAGRGGWFAFRGMGRWQGGEIDAAGFKFLLELRPVSAELIEIAGVELWLNRDAVSVPAKLQRKRDAVPGVDVYAKMIAAGIGQADGMKRYQFVQAFEPDGKRRVGKICGRRSS